MLCMLKTVASNYIIMHYILSGDCWFISGAVCLVTFNKALFERVVPKDQTFKDRDYAGKRKHLSTQNIYIIKLNMVLS